jgi:hypothetical protein
VKVKNVEEKKEVEINEEKIERLMKIMNEEEKKEKKSDKDEMLNLEEKVNEMGNMIEKELEKVDSKNEKIKKLSYEIVEDMKLYNKMMRENEEKK